MIHDKEFISIVRARRKLFVLLFAASAVAAITIGVYEVYFNKFVIPGGRTYQEILQLYKKTTVTTQTGAHELLLETADTPEKRQRGLMFRRAVAVNSGMIFPFEEDTQTPFWMKNTLVSLDILFVSAEGKVVDMLTMEPCKDGEECTRYLSSKPYRYAIEVAKGFVESSKVRMGDAVSFAQ